jgi:hypothetical protein
MVLEIDIGSTRSHSVKNSRSKRLQTCRQRDSVMNE